MKVLVIGAKGQLGHEIMLQSLCSEHTFVFADLSGDGDEVKVLDIADPQQVNQLISDDIDVIVNCAAYNEVDKAEDDVELCALLNAKAPENLAVAMKEVDGLLIHVSTDYVFGGDPYNTPCREEQKGTPTGVYGLTKLQGEQAIVASGCHHIIIRTAWLYSEFGKNFVKTMLSLTASKPQLNVVFDQTGTPTYALDLAEVIFDIVENRKYVGNDGVYHYSNEGVCSWFDFTKMIAEYAGKNIMVQQLVIFNHVIVMNSQVK